MRISLTPSTKCNFKCIFCHMEGIYEDAETTMTPEEIERVMKILKKYGINNVKLTGGEPMLRSDIVEIVERLHNIGFEEISMTTNGTRFPQLAKRLRDAGLNRVNISLHSINAQKFCWITGAKPTDGEKRLQYTIDAIKAAFDAGMDVVKLNVVVMKGVNEDEIEDMIRFVKNLGYNNCILQLIELVHEGDASDSEFFQKYYYNLGPVEDSIKKRAIKCVTRKLQMRRQYLLPENVWVEFVRPMRNCDFCMNDSRIRITHDGKFKPCLMRDDNHVDFLTPMRNGASDEELERLFIKAVYLREPFWKTKEVQPSDDVIIVHE
ncbi:MAG: GTP 3',8-cyclase MoaA [Thaumarchaeota archaeon]|nr:GTP 3',8-cyclase MoaA [Candidatus Terraquivivens yellowstonensis]MCL7392886.1 GTP 3',8-cyclase MoaA [Candidatus Terraquivivens yellowstonensis]MCL7398102.1 GTP 3',8-cyclase MoaA [Candidatus Terraquivivens yellowstonensis]MCL7400895.1 GTP 3',8-cyclase MoaA [Candidatus Terraquivivens yellowstonensis]